MDAAELKTLIAKELKTDPEIYKSAVAPALAESGLPCATVIGTYADLIGLETGKVFRNWMNGFEQRKAEEEERERAREAKRQKRLEAEENKQREKQRKLEEQKAAFEAWRSRFGRVYSLGDFPDWVIRKMDALSENGARAVLKKTAKWIMRQDPTSFYQDYRDMNTQFYVFDDEVFFTAAGYRFLIITGPAREWITEQEKLHWISESGMFDGES